MFGVKDNCDFLQGVTCSKGTHTVPEETVNPESACYFRVHIPTKKRTTSKGHRA